jgi:hypothetical protein
VRGKQVKESEVHEMEISVQLEAANARVAVRLDDQPFYQWSGPRSVLRPPSNLPPVVPGSLALVTHCADWVVHAVKVKRLEGKP